MTRVRTDFPRKVRELENVWIPMPDGVRLAARIWLPEDADDDPVPAILEYLPYRKRDGTVRRDHLTHPYFAGFGYAGVRVDMRGTGDSEGVCLGEYLLQEQDDAVAVIDWLAAQPWCAGKVGMIGISWGGFNGLQVAARRPSALGAVITLCSTDDRYADDIHFMGGCCLTDKLAWGATAFTIANTPPDPEIVGERWLDMWKERIESNGLWMLDWFRHQRRDAFYAHGSICENYGNVEVPVYAVGGWADGYTNAIFRMMERLKCPRKALIGPWAHKYPHFATPGPRIGFLQECLRWWDQHLKGVDTGVMDEPMVRAWIQDPAPPSAEHNMRPGRWVAEPDFVSPGGAPRSWFPSAGDLRDVDQCATLVLASPENAGWTAPSWCAYGVDPDGAIDQNGEAGLMTVFETEPISEDIDLLGFPMLYARASADAPQANLAATLSAVDSRGRAALISFGVLNLTHAKSHAAPEPLAPGAPVSIQLQLNACGQRIAKGQKLRLGLSTAYWPVIWPSQSSVTVTLEQPRLDLPLRAPCALDDQLAPFREAEGALPLETETLSEWAYRRARQIDYATGVETFERISDSGEDLHKHTGIATRSTTSEVFSIHPSDPNTASGRCKWTKSFARGGWRAEVETEVTVQALAQAWRVAARLTARQGDELVAEREWREDIARDHV